MTDYAKWKVTDLKAELKRRGIPQTGLKVKQNFIDKLLEADSAAEKAAGAAPEQDTKQNADNAEQSLTVEQNDGELDQELQAHPEPEPTKSRGEEPAAEPERSEIATGNRGAQDEEQEQAAPEPAQETSEKPASQEALEEAKELSPEPRKASQHSEETLAPPKISSKPSLTREQSTPVPAEEIVDDVRKRKRRSPSPHTALDPIVQKRVKGDNGSPHVLLKEDVGAENLPQRTVGDASDVDMKEATSDREPVTPAKRAVSDSGKPQVDETARHASPAASPSYAKPKDHIPFTNREQEYPQAPSQDLPTYEDEGRTVEPALHPATSALYIRNFMRPLQPTNLKNYLISLATPPTASPNPDIILEFFLDSIKTHCFVNFANVSAASRVRSALHSAVWPSERDRKPLWVDFIPEDKFSKWIGIERDSEGRGRSGPRWEVVYEQTDDGIKASLQEAQSLTAAAPAAGGGRGRGRETGPDIPRAPLGPRGSLADRDPRRGRQASADPRARGEGFKALDDLFRSTTAKPKLYYLPVPKEVADRRLNKFNELARHGPHPRPGGDETRRITFEDTDFFVDQGPEYGARRRGGRGRGGLRDSWRGRGR